MNSLYGVTGWDRFRLYDKEGAAAVTATGREVIDFTEEAANELNYQVSYGDTDSVMLSLSNMSKEEAIETSFEIEDHINERYDDFARDELNADVHRFQIESKSSTGGSSRPARRSGTLATSSGRGERRR